MLDKIEPTGLRKVTTDAKKRQNPFFNGSRTR